MYKRWKPNERNSLIKNEFKCPVESNKDENRRCRRGVLLYKKFVIISCKPVSNLLFNIHFHHRTTPALLPWSNKNKNAVKRKKMNNIKKRKKNIVGDEWRNGSWFTINLCTANFFISSLFIKTHTVWKRKVKVLHRVQFLSEMNF